MSAHHASTRKTLTDIRSLYKSGTPISMVTGYDYITGQMAEAAEVDINLVGDSLAMVALGYEDTNEIPFDEFLYHVKAVHRGNKHSLLVADVPFGSFERNPEQALDLAVALVKNGRVQAVKIEGGVHMVPSIRKIVEAGIPVMGHTGLTPQHHHALGGFKLQGQTLQLALQVYKDCLALQDAGVFSIVLECIPNKLAEYITGKLQVPTIGIGAGPHCSGQVLVMLDLLGMSAHSVPKFVKQYANFHKIGADALAQYHLEVTSHKFPSADTHGYKIKSQVLADFKAEADKII